MIRINLLGTTKKKGQRAKRPALSMQVLPTEGPSMLLVGAVLAVLAIAGNYYYYSHAESARKGAQEQLAAANRKSANLAGVKQKYLERQKEADELKRRVDVVDQLRANQQGPSQLLNQISVTVDSTDAVWLNHMTDDGALVHMDGVALTPTALAKLMTNLRNSGYFKNVELDETYEENFKSVTAFSFRLTCEKAKA